MAENKKVEAITSRDDDFAQWYTDVVKKAELIDYTSVAGCIIVRPYACAIWELITAFFDGEIKKTGHENVHMPLFIPESLLQKEKDHVAGFAPEVAWVTHGGSEKLTERLCIRPTSETLFCEHYKNIVQSHRDLPKLYNQWCSVVRWEKSTRPFLRTREFWWQEGHTAHATAEEALKETMDILDLYEKVSEEFLAMPVIKGVKTNKEKFAGAEATYGIENLMHDGKALQAATSHYFGDGFAKAFDIRYTGKNNEQNYVFQTSWGMTTRLIGALIMVHGDDNGLVLPPKAAPIQVVVVPVSQHKEGVLPAAEDIYSKLSAKARVKLDASDKSPGWKFAEWEMKGVPIRLEIGPRDLAEGNCVLARRDTGEKTTVKLDCVEQEITALLERIHDDMLKRATELRDNKTYIAQNIAEMEQIINSTPGFIKAMWCGDEACEIEIKDKMAITSRCIPFEQEAVGDTCVCCGKKADKLVYWGRAY